MKKSIIALMGLFTLIACSEDSYQEADKMSEKRTGTVENTGAQNSVKTVSPGYRSPYQPYTTGGNIGMRTLYVNNTPLQLVLTVYAAELHTQTFLFNNGTTYPPALPLPFQLTTYPSAVFPVNPGVNINQDCGGFMSTLIPNPPGCQQGNIVYDFGNVLLNWDLLHYGKIHFFKYEVFDASGSFVTSGYLKQKFYTDGLDSATITSISGGQWQYLTDVSGLPPMYDAVAMYHISQDEICIAQGAGATAVLESSVVITDPATGTNHTLEFTTDTPMFPNTVAVMFN